MPESPEHHPSTSMDPASTAAGDGLLVVISGPSGVGKTTIARGVERAIDEAMFSVSVTTRTRTAADREGVDYCFVDDAEFDRMVAAGELLEWARVFDRRYGTPRARVSEALALGRVVILEIDVAGAIQVRRAMPEAFGIFILPPSEQDLLARLRSRGREGEEQIQRRFAEAQREIAQAKSCNAYDLFIVNRDLDAAVREAIASVRTRRDTAGADSAPLS